MAKSNVHKISILGFIILLTGLGYYSFSLYQKLLAEKQTISLLQTKIASLEEDIANREQEKNELQNSLLAEQARVNDISDQFDDLADTVGTLEKLSKTDKELLQKYSKVYFLNEHYVPENLSTIKEEYLILGKKDLQIHSKVYPFLKDMLEEAESDGVNIQIASAYRSFSTQASLKSNYAVKYGTGANTFSADQGFSEHQLGTTLDFSNKTLQSNFINFEQSQSYKWLTENAYRFGFVLSYPKNNKYYIFEPWHWRFVGIKLAKKLHKENKNFYDLEQREIDKYLVSIFD